MERVLRTVQMLALDLHDSCRLLTEWEDEHLLDNPTPEQLREHARMLTAFEWQANKLASATEDPAYPDQETTGLVRATLQNLKDRRALWHGSTMTEQQRETLLREVFGES